MTIATAWAALAKQENAAYRKKWGTGLQQQKREDPKPKRREHGKARITQSGWN